MKHIINTNTYIADLMLTCPFLNASGPMGWIYEYASLLNYTHIGAFVLKGLTKEKRTGNSVRLQILQQGIINSIGLENPGIASFLQYTYPTIKKYIHTFTNNVPMPLIANINGIEQDDYVYLTQKLNAIVDIQGIEINISCPNIHKGGLHLIQEKTIIQNIVRSVKQSTNKIIIVKIPYIPDTQTLHSIIETIQDNGGDAISAINTISTQSTTFANIQTQYKLHNTIVGGLSGSYIKPYALKTIRDIRTYSKIPIIGIGGIQSIDDVIHFFQAGVTAVGIGSAVLYNPNIFTLLYCKLLEYMQIHNISSMTELYHHNK